jgi:hypothetical protein
LVQRIIEAGGILRVLKTRVEADPRFQGKLRGAQSA